jgi:hypothetical protein
MSLKVSQIDLSNKRQVRDFLDLPFRLYQDNPYWVPTLRMDDRLRLNPKRFPFYQHSQAGFFVAYDDERPVGRIVAIENRRFNEYNRKKTAFFYMFECEDSHTVADALFQTTFDWALANGLDTVIGPKGFTPLDGIGLLVEGFQHRPALEQPYNPAYYVDLIEAQGFEPQRDLLSGYLSADIDFPERVHKLSERIQKRRGLRIARYNSRKDLLSLLPHLKNLYNHSLTSISGNAPLTDAEMSSMANQLLWFADPKLIKIVMKDDDPVGFLLAYPDISAALQKCKGRLFPFGWLTVLREFKRTDWLNINGAGLLPEYRGLGGTAILFSEMYKSVVEGGQFRQAEVVQIGTENENMQREMQNFGIDFYKMHRLYVKKLSN